MGMIRLLLVLLLFVGPVFGATVETRKLYDEATDTIEADAPDDTVILGYKDGGWKHYDLEHVRAGLLDQTTADTLYDSAGAAAGVQTNLTTHASDATNPHGVTAAQVGADPAGTDNSGLTADQKAAISAANTPSAANPVATQNDLPASAADVPFDDSESQLGASDTQSAVDAAAAQIATKASLSGATFTGSITAPSIVSSAADGYHFANIYNSISFAGTPSVGDIQLNSDFEFVYWDGDSWEDPVNIVSGGGTWGSITGTITDQTDLTAYVSSAVSDAITALGIDVTPTAFSFTDVTDADLSTTYTACAQITGINFPTVVSSSGFDSAICTSSDYANDCGTFSTTPGNVENNGYVCAQNTSSATNGDITNNIITAGGVSDTFSVTTAAAGGACTSVFSQSLTDSTVSIAFSPGASFTIASDIDNPGITLTLSSVSNGSSEAIPMRIGTTSNLTTYTMETTAIPTADGNLTWVFSGTLTAGTYYWGVRENGTAVSMSIARYGASDIDANTTYVYGNADTWNLASTAARDMTFTVSEDCQ